MFYQVNDIIECVVASITKYGIFVKDFAHYTGLIHISEISNSFVPNISKYAKIGQTIYCRIIGIDENKKQLRLSIKDIDNKKYTRNIKESPLGFEPLQKALPKWIDQKIKEYNIEK